MPQLPYDNDRDRFENGFDAGLAMDGEVQLDVATGEYIVVDDEGVAFSSQALLRMLLGKKIRLTCISFESMENIEKLLASSGVQVGGAGA